jgi:hypothetical protein
MTPEAPTLSTNLMDYEEIATLHIALEPERRTAVAG